MIRGTTAQFKFDLPYNFSNIDVVQIKFWQPYNNNANLPIVKYKSSCSATSNAREISVNLTPEETLRFSDEHKMYVQLRAKSTEGSTFASRQERFTVYPLSDDSPLVPIDPGPTPTPGGDVVYLDGGTIGG